MSCRGRRFATIAILGALWVAGCAPATPTPEPASPTAVAARTTAAAASPSPAAASPTVEPPEGLAAEIEVLSLDPEVADDLAEFASDGRFILFSSGRAEDADPGVAPDLWGVDVASGETEPELLWRNPERSHAIVRITGDLGTVAFVETPTTGERAWNLWVLPNGERQAVLLDSHPGDAGVPSLVPSADVEEFSVVWAAFDVGADGRPISQLLRARAPDWEPTVILERDASLSELWFPSIRGGQLAYTEVTYSEDRQTDERAVHLLDLTAQSPEPVRLDDSGLATMPLVVDRDVVLWKEAPRGMSMFSWGRMMRHDVATGTTEPISIRPQEQVNYPSNGSRFLAWWGSDTFRFGVYDLLLDRAREISDGTERRIDVLRPHVAWNLLVWLEVEDAENDGPATLRYVMLPDLRAPP